MRSRSTIYLVLAISPLIAQPAHADSRMIRADVWGDNWFAVYVGDKLIKEDSTPYNTERSFNSESFTFQTELPAHLNVVMKDFKENDTGLEYIGTSGQQMGDGGFAAQFFDAETDELLAVSNSAWRCLTIHRAPLNKSCVSSSDPAADCEFETIEAPEGWMNAAFDDSEWPNAVEHSARAVRPLRGYHDVEWHPDMRLIWGADLEMDNTILCRTTLVESGQ